MQVSLGGAEGATGLKVVRDRSILVACVKRHFVGSALFALNLDVDVTEVIDGERFTFGSVHALLTLIANLIEALAKLLRSFSLVLVVERSQEGVVSRVSVQLERVLVESEKSVVAVRQIGKRAALKKLS